MPAISMEQLMLGKQRLEQARHGERSSIVQGLSRLWDCSVSQVYSYLSEVGWSSQRKVRSDAGQSVVTRAEAIRLAEWRAMNIRKNGKLMSDIAQAKDVLWRSGQISPDAYAASDSTWARVLRTMGLSGEHLCTPSLAVETDALHPNHRHQFDASIGILYYLDRGGMKFRRHQDMDAKNKPQQFAKTVFGRELLIRWALVDVYSGAFVVDYCLAPGESTADMLDFLHYAWSAKADKRWPFHGVPVLLEGDQAGPNSSEAMQALCKGLDIKLHLHTPSPQRDDASGARAKGSVETLMNYWEREMESLWRSEAPSTLEQLRRQAADMCIKLNSDPKCTFRRTRHTRSQLWMEITEEQLRTVPDRVAYRSLAVGRSFERVIENHGWLNVEGRTFKIEHCTWLPKEHVQVRFDIWDPNRLTAYNPRTGETKQAVYLELKNNGKTVAAIIPGQEDPELSSRQPLHAAAKLKIGVGQDVRAKKGVAEPGRWKAGLEDQSTGLIVEFAPRVGRPAVNIETTRWLDDWDVLDMAVARLNRTLEPAESVWLSEQVKGRISEGDALALIETLATRAGEQRQVLAFGGRA